MKYEVIRKGFLECTNLTWDDIELEIENEIKKNTCRIIGDNDEDEKTYLLLDYENFCPSISEIRAIMIDKYRLNALHVYTSKNDAKTFGRHYDLQNVLIVQAIGKMSYKFDDQNLVILEPGDGLYIPKEMYHDPIPFEPRVTLSFSWD